MFTPQHYRWAPNFSICNERSQQRKQKLFLKTQQALHTDVLLLIPPSTGNKTKYAAHWANTWDTPARQTEEKVSPARTKLFACCLQRTPRAWGLLTPIPTTALSNCKWRGSVESTKRQVLCSQEAKNSLSQAKLRPQSTFSTYLLIRSWARKLSCIPVFSVSL